MPAWIHERAKHLLAKNPDMSKSTAFAVATQQAHKLGKTPKGYGTTEGRAAAKAKYSGPKKDYVKAPNPGRLDTKKLAAQARVIVTIEASPDGAEAIEKLLARISEVGDVGHSFGIIEDDPPGGKKVHLGSWDGDGACRVFKVTSQAVPSRFEKSAGWFDPNAWRAQSGFTPQGFKTPVQRLKKTMGVGAFNADKGLKPLQAKVAAVRQVVAEMKLANATRSNEPHRGKQLAAAGLVLGGNMGVDAANDALESAVRHEGALPGTKSLFGRLVDRAAVPVELDRSLGAGGYYTRTGGPKAVVGKASPATLAHELGHAAIDKTRVGRLLQSTPANVLSRALVPSIGAAGTAGYLLGSDDRRAQLAGAGLGAAGTAALLAPEVGASHTGLKTLRGLSAGPAELKAARRAMGAGLGSYAARAAMLGGVALGAGTLRRVARDKQRETQPKVKEGFTRSEFSGDMNPPSMKYHSSLPPFTAPPLKTAGPPSEKQKKAGLFSPASQLSKAKSVGTLKMGPPPGPSIAQIAKPVGFGKPLPGATKTPATSTRM